MTTSKDVNPKLLSGGNPQIPKGDGGASEERVTIYWPKHLGHLIR